MPRASVWFIRAALLYLLAGFGLGAVLLADKGLHAGFPARWLALHLEWLLVGWLMQLVMGVAYWMFPRFGMSRAARGREALAWLALLSLNVGMALVSVGALNGYAAWMLVGRAAEVGAVLVMTVNVWARTRASGLSPT